MDYGKMVSMVLEWEPIRRPHRRQENHHRDVVGFRLRYRGDRLQLNRWSRQRLYGFEMIFVGILVLFELRSK